MKWCENLYIGSRAKEKRWRIIWKTNHGKLQNGVFLLTLPSNEENQLDIIPANLLLQPYYKKKDIRTAGSGVGKAEALEVLTEMMQDVFEKTGKASLREYLKKQEWK